MCAREKNERKNARTEILRIKKYLMIFISFFDPENSSNEVQCFVLFLLPPKHSQVRAQARKN